MKPKVYVETTVISYYTAKPSNDIFLLARQRVTEQWWSHAVQNLSLFISEAVIEEAREGDKVAAAKRLEHLNKMPSLEINEDTTKIYQIYIKELPIPPKAHRDALHIAVASIHGMDYIVSWNCKHIANGFIIKKIMEINTRLGIPVPVIVTPDELLEESK
ncbi:MAG: type II toxin-antitoxin system VapC family toxin [Fibrobacteres bacterium]|nr:type II toxin-antitoxin system VapC family toxin [Fibrobacterota bacterium]